VRDPADIAFTAAWLTRREREGGDAITRLAAFLVRSFRLAPGITPDDAAIEALRDTPAFAMARDVVAEVRAAGPAAGVPAGVPVELGLFHLAERWDVAPADLETAALDRGYTSLAGPLDTVRRCLGLARQRPDLFALA
jgi:hypothetical protein